MKNLMTKRDELLTAFHVISAVSRLDLERSPAALEKALEDQLILAESSRNIRESMKGNHDFH